MENDERLKEYSERHRYWSQFAINQLSYTNNVFLVISIGIFSYIFEKCYQKIVSDVELKCETLLYIWSLLSILFSILYGLMVTIARLVDFRITRELNNIRKKILKLKNAILNGCECEYDKPDQCERIYSNLKAICLMFCWDSKVNLSKKNTIDILSTYNELNVNYINDANFKLQFNDLRRLSHNLGIISWKYTTYQILSLLIGILLFIISNLNI